MRQRGRKSAAGLLVVDVGRKMPSKPPAELTDARAQVWRDVVSTMSADCLVRGGFPILVEYARHVCRRVCWKRRSRISRRSGRGAGQAACDGGSRDKSRRLLCSRSATDAARAIGRAADRRALTGVSLKMPWE